MTPAVFTLSFVAGGRLSLPCRVSLEMSSSVENIQEFVTHLLNKNGPVELEVAWDHHNYDVDEVHEAAPSEFKNIVAAGDHWNGSNWTTGKASKQIYALANVGLVMDSFVHYKKTFLYGLALYWNIDVPQFALPDGCSNGALAIATFEGFGPNVAGAHAANMGNHGEDLVPPFDDVVMEMSPQMAETWKRTRSVVRDALSPKVALESVPGVEGIPHKAQNNNHREDWKTRQRAQSMATKPIAHFKTPSIHWHHLGK